MTMAEEMDAWASKQLERQQLKKAHQLGMDLKDPNPTRRPITEYEAHLIQALAHCTFYPGSWDKRFCRDVASDGTKEKGITLKQAFWIRRLAHKYRKQLHLSDAAAAAIYQEAEKILQENTPNENQHKA